MNTMTDATRGLLKNGLVFAFLGYTLYEFVTEYLRGTSEGFAPWIFILGLLILGGGTLFTGILTLRAWKASQSEAAEAIDAQERAKLESQFEEE